MNRVRPAGLPPVPWLSWFMELNVRTYVIGPDGVPGVWFFSLAANQPVAVEIARRAFYLNYVHARMRSKVSEGRMHYVCERTKPAEFLYKTAKVCREASPQSLEFFLLERYVLFASSARGRLYAGRIHHPPYLFESATVDQWSFQPAVDDGFASPGRPPDHSVVALDQAVEAWPIYPI